MGDSETLVAPKHGFVDLTPAFDAIVAANKSLALAKDLQVTDAPSADQAGKVREELKAIEKRIEEQRKLIVKPLSDEKARLDAYAKKVSAPVTEAKDILTKRISSWQQEEKRKADEANRKAEEERAAQILKEKKEREKEERRLRDLELAKQVIENDALASADDLAKAQKFINKNDGKIRRR
jgi:hypothetical protein